MTESKYERARQKLLQKTKLVINTHAGEHLTREMKRRIIDEIGPAYGVDLRIKDIIFVGGYLDQVHFTDGEIYNACHRIQPITD